MPDIYISRNSCVVLNIRTELYKVLIYISRNLIVVYNNVFTLTNISIYISRNLCVVLNKRIKEWELENLH